MQSNTNEEFIKQLKERSLQMEMQVKEFSDSIKKSILKPQLATTPCVMKSIFDSIDNIYKKD